MPPPRPMPKAKTTNEVRVLFRPAPDAPPVSLFVRIAAQPGGVVLTLLYDYPPGEFAPQPGWLVEASGKTYTITAAQGRRIEATEQGV